MEVTQDSMCEADQQIREHPGPSPTQVWAELEAAIFHPVRISAMCSQCVVPTLGRTCYN